MLGGMVKGRGMEGAMPEVDQNPDGKHLRYASHGRCPTMEETELVPAYKELDYYHPPWYEDISYEELRRLLG